MTASKMLAGGLLAVAASGFAHGQDTQNWKPCEDWALAFRNAHMNGVIAASGGIDRFWLDGALRISAMEQIVFLNQLYNNQLDAKPEFQWRTKDAMLIEATDSYVLRGKTGYSLGMPGTGDRSKPGTGWWVGWIEVGTHTHIFAANFDIIDENDLPKRKSLPLSIFQAEGWLGNR